jgi:hypothetical protein
MDDAAADNDDNDDDDDDDNVFNDYGSWVVAIDIYNAAEIHCLHCCVPYILLDNVIDTFYADFLK